MAKVKIIKKLPKGKYKIKKKTAPTKTTASCTNQFTEKYLQFYDDIKIPSKRYDW